MLDLRIQQAQKTHTHTQQSHSAHQSHDMLSTIWINQKITEHPTACRLTYEQCRPKAWCCSNQHLGCGAVASGGAGAAGAAGGATSSVHIVHSSSGGFVHHSGGGFVHHSSGGGFVHHSSGGGFVHHSSGGGFVHSSGGGMIHEVHGGEFVHHDGGAHIVHVEHHGWVESGSQAFTPVLMSGDLWVWEWQGWGKASKWAMNKKPD